MLVEIIRTTKKETSYTSASSLLRQVYEQYSGLHDYFLQKQIESNTTDPNLKRPLSSISFKKGEDIYAHTRTFDIIKAFADNNVKEFYNMSLVEFLNLPHVICAFILEDCQKRVGPRLKDMNNMMQQMQRLGKK